MRALGIDLGTKRVGLAVGDSETSLALPLRTIEASASLEALAVELLAIAREEECDTVVVGLPLNLDGSPSLSSKKAQKLAKLLRASAAGVGMRVELWDERMSTSAAHRSVMSASGARASVRRERIDPIAASIFLQAFLDSRAR